MSDWAALREQIRRDYFVIKKEQNRLLLACMLPYGKWYARVRGPGADGGELEVAVIVKNGAGVSAQYIVLREKLPIAGLVYSELRQTIDGLTAQAARVAFAMQPDEAIFAMRGHG